MSREYQVGEDYVSETSTRQYQFGHDYVNETQPISNVTVRARYFSIGSSREQMQKANIHIGGTMNFS